MNTLAGWGFRTPEALARHFGMLPASVASAVRKRGGPHRRQEEFEEYVATLTRAPSIEDVRVHFRCSRPSAYNYRRKVVAILAARREPA